MSSRSLLLVLLVLTCLQSFTMGQSQNEPGVCCFNFQMRRIPVDNITEYKQTRRGCVKDGIIFILKNGRRVCVDPGVKWVKGHMITVDQRLYASTKKP
ncbi:C-C motif chemokine 3-like [Clarias gariepinus]|uniref:C-C motif chemokine 3-like n=1 Tax=Clarias gariepinus TaxID=13013 RepID=UPI00234E0FA0|nr:C-C motif chemokine 3-like [Clarias gariepinus]